MAHPGTYVNGPTLGVAGLITGDADTAIVCANSGNKHVESVDTFSGEFSTLTIEAIVKPSNLTANGTVCGFNEVTPGFRLTGPDSSGIFYFDCDTTTSGWSANTTSPVIANDVCHVVGTWDGTTAKIYLNGVPEGTDTCPENPILAAVKFFGGSDSFANAIDGTLDEVAFYDTALSAGRIAAHFAGVSSGAYSDEVLADVPILYWRLDEPSGTVAADSAPSSGGAALVPSISADFTSGSDTISTYARDKSGLSITRGVTTPALTGFIADAGHAVSTISNRDLRFDPNNLSGPYVTAGETDVVPGVPITIQVAYP